MSIKAAREAIKAYVEHYNFERVHMGIGYLTPADRFFNSADAVSKAMNQAANDQADLYLTGTIDGQPLRLLKEKCGKITIYLAGSPVKELKNTTAIKALFL